MDISLSTPNSIFSEQSSQQRYILSRVGNQQIIFSDQWVAEIMLIERTQILNLPFYNRILLGIIHHQGNIVPLISSHILLSEKLGMDVRQRGMLEKLTVICLSQAVDKLAGVGVVVEQVVGSFLTEPLPEQHIFQLSDLPAHIWQPC
jgi:chemotaxis signal transduction protein